MLLLYCENRYSKSQEKQIKIKCNRSIFFQASKKNKQKKQQEKTKQNKTKKNRNVSSVEISDVQFISK